MAPLHDAHCHLDFMTNGEQVAAEAETAGSLIFANTVEPSGFAEACARFGAYKNVRIGLGLHPWWIKNDTVANHLNTLERNLDATRYVGEVGLDFGRRGEGTHDIQVSAFKRIACLCAEAGGRVLSIHAVKSAETVLDILEETGALVNCTCIFHWFSDTSAQLIRARQAGCYFSANPMMASTKRGREYIRAIEADRLLLETDAPPGQNTSYSYAELSTQLAEAADAIAAIRGPAVLDTIASTAERLLV